MADAEWPASFTPWTPDNTSATEKWFKNRRNTNFKPWINAIADNPKDWVGLSQCLCSTLDIRRLVFSTICQAECTAYWGQLQRGKRTTKKDLAKLGPKIATSLLEVSKVAWKKQATVWVQQACVAFAPRAVSLWKKIERRKETGAERNTQGLDCDAEVRSVASEGPSGTPVASSDASAPRQPGKGKERALRRHPKRQKKQATTYEQEELSVVIEDELLHRQQGIQIRQLVHRKIVVLLDKATAEAESAPYHTVIGIAAIVDNDAQCQKDKDIRCEHLSYAKFCKILRSVHRAYDPSKMYLEYELPEDNGQILTREVHQDEDSFKEAVGMWSWYSGVAGVEGDLLMKLSAPRSEIASRMT